jgi:3-dehydroquinate dehydratase/shikimate dehydrogenase
MTVPVRVCVSICESSVEKARTAALEAARWADVVEIRGDFIRDLNVRQLLRGKTSPVLFTLRSRQEGGEFTGSEWKRLETILEAAQCGADYVDTEYSGFWKIVLATVPRSRVVLSSHDYAGTRADLDSLLDEMGATGAGVIKIASQATCLADNLRIARLLNQAGLRGINLAALAMGRAGTISRVLGPHWGSWMTFASAPGGAPAAEGQIPADVLVEQYRLRQIGPQTELYGVLGKPLGHSLSPLIHNAAFAARGKDALMAPLEASSMEDFQAISAELPVRGASVTLPYKEKACLLAGSLSVQAQHTGAVNTLTRRERGWHGDNTDIEGFIRPLKRRLHPGRMRAVVLGAGGGARAVVYGLKSQGAAVCVVARDTARARLLAEKFQAEHAAWKELPNLHWNILVNATPVGMYPDVEDSPVPAEWLGGEWVYDLVYNPGETRLLREAAQRGCRTISGVEMFLAQAAKQQALWCGLPIPEERMEQVLRSAIAGGVPQK